MDSVAQDLISAERLRELLDYNPETGVFTWRASRQGHVKAGDVCGSLGNGYRQTKINGQMYLLHRLAFLWMLGEMPFQVDHINRNPSDNRWCNLRPCTSSLNRVNRAHTARSGYRGVVPNGNGWAARLQYQRKTYCLGTYPTKEQAAEAYNVKAREMFGEFAP